MKPRFHRHSRPNCGHRRGWFNLLPSAIWASWRCESCQSLLCFSPRRRFLASGTFGIWLVFLHFLVSPKILNGVLDLFVFVTLLSVGGFAAFSLDAIQLADSGSTDTKGSSNNQ